MIVQVQNAFYINVGVKIIDKKIFQQYYNSGRMMFKLAEALGRLALAGREMTRLAGFTTRVDMLIDVLDDLDKGYYRKAMIKGANLKNPNADNSLVHNSIADGAGGKIRLIYDIYITLVVVLPL